MLSRLRTDLGEKLGPHRWPEWDVLFVVDFPLFEREDDGSLTYAHQPFVAPLEEDLHAAGDGSRSEVRGTHYDVVMNGVELGSGSLRNHRSDVQRQDPRSARLQPKAGDAEARFGFLLNALDTGAPPHGGFAFGFDRWAMLLWRGSTACAM